jgi:uncharacterized protein YkwD
MKRVTSVSYCRDGALPSGPSLCAARGEVIGWGYGGDSGKMVSWWMSCPAHRPVILSGRFSDFGVGYVRDPESECRSYWTVDLGRRVDPASSE